MLCCRHFIGVSTFARWGHWLVWAVTWLMVTIALAQPNDLERGRTELDPGSIQTNFDLSLQPIDEANPTPLTLTYLEQLALQNNPTLSVASANVDAARGRQIQAGLRPNPQIGYFGMDIGEDDTAGQHGGFVSKEFVTGGKLRICRAVSGQEVEEMQYRLSAQELRVLNDVRMRFYEALTVQRQVELTDELVGVSEQLTKARLSIVTSMKKMAMLISAIDN